MSQPTPPGWYPDGSGVLRYWDGTQWTQHVQAGSALPVPGGARSVQDEKGLATLSHVLGIFTGFLGPLVIYLLVKDDQPFARHHAAESLNFQITYTVALIVCVLLFLVLIGIVMIFVVWVLGIVWMIMAAVAANRGEWYRYPVNIRMVPGARG